MKKLANILIILSLTVFSQLPSPALATDIFRILTLRISATDKTATIYWTTNLPSTGRFDFGLTNGFGNWIGDNLENNYHETTLSGLTGDQKYYFKITAYSAIDDQIIVSDIYTFETNNENDHDAPILGRIKTTLITGNTATFNWETDEPSDTCIKFGTLMTELDRENCNGDKVKIHDITIKELTKNTRYFYQASSRDESDNKQSSITFEFNTYFENDTNAPDLIIYEVSPINQKAGDDLYNATITLKTNRPVEGTLRYGEKTNEYDKEVRLPVPRSTETNIILTDLKKDQTYYYKLNLTDVLDKTMETQEYSFNTLPKNILNGQISAKTDYDPKDPNQDFDQDGLTNEREKQYSTDPVKADSDGDGYPDGIETKNGFNPLGQGALKIKKNNSYYDQERLKSLKAEQNLAQDLKDKLVKEFNGRVPKNSQSWQKLVNAYIYGGYSVKAIAQAIKLGGKTVHPTIPLSAWQSTADYQNYINK